jgi:MraZ protein
MTRGNKMFRGSNSATLDSKGRLVLPSRIRDTLSGLSENKVVVTIDMREPCLLFYPLSYWEIVQRKLESLSNINPQARLLQRLLIGHATDLDLDNAGRLLLPIMLREYAQLEKKLILIGQGNKIEIWSEHNWHQRMSLWIENGAKALVENADFFEGLSV